MTVRFLSVFLPILLLLSLLVTPSPASEEFDADAERALKSIGRQTWYDREADSYSPPKTSDERDSPIRVDGWVAEKANERRKKKAENANSQNRGSWNWGLSGIDTNFFSTLVISSLALALIVVILLLTYHSLQNYMPGRWEVKGRTQSIEIDSAKVSELPFEVDRPSQLGPLEEAEALWRSGNYSQAMIFLYGYLLLALDQSRRIDLQRGKTNRMYLRELKPHVELREIVEQSMLAFEEVYFGKHALSREQFMSCWSHLERFHELVAPTPEPATSAINVEAATA